MELGKKAIDKVSGFTGMLTAKIEYLYGNDRYLIDPKVCEDNKYQEGQWFDEERIELAE
jgi:hypothetical protein